MILFVLTGLKEKKSSKKNEYEWFKTQITFFSFELASIK
jgi:hypothetical protein